MKIKIPQNNGESMMVSVSDSTYSHAHNLLGLIDSGVLVPTTEREVRWLIAIIKQVFNLTPEQAFGVVYKWANDRGEK